MHQGAGGSPALVGVQKSCSGLYEACCFFGVQSGEKPKRSIIYVEFFIPLVKTQLVLFARVLL